jgi:hypothetical protein
LDAGEIETAYAGLVYSPLLSDAVRSGHWLLLAAHYREHDLARAAVCYRAVLDQVALSPTLSDIARGDISLQAARGYAALAKPQVARLALTQAENIARYSLTLLPAQRRGLLEQVAAGYQLLGDTRTAAAIRNNLEGASVGPGIQLEPSPQVLPGLLGSVVLPTPVTSAILARQQAAANLAARWLSSAPSGRSDLAKALGEALEAEDAARTDFYAGASELSTPERLALLHDQVTWLTIKYRTARGAYGVSLVPAWDAQTAEIREALIAAYTDLINGYGQQLDTLSPGDAMSGRVELLRQGLLWSRLGLFPDHAEATLSNQLKEASLQFWTRQGSSGLTIVVQEVKGTRFYLLSGSDSAQASTAARYV